MAQEKSLGVWRNLGIGLEVEQNGGDIVDDNRELREP